MNVEPIHLTAGAAMLAALVSISSFVGAMFGRRVKAAKQEGEEHAQIGSLAHRLRSLEQTKEIEVPNLRQVESLVRENSVQIGHLTGQVNRLVDAQEGGRKEVHEFMMRVMERLPGPERLDA